MAQRLVTITLPEADALRAVDMLLSFSWISNLDVSTATRCLVVKHTPQKAAGGTMLFEGVRCHNVQEEDLEVEEKLLQVVKVQFKVRAKHLGATIKALKAENVGVSVGTVDVTDVRVSTEALPKQPNERRRSNFCRSLTDRMSTLEIHESIVSHSHLNTDHVACVVVASMMAAIGLITNNTVDILASFFVSPLMTMLLGVTWGTCVREGSLVKRSLRNMTVDASVAVFVGYVFAFGLGVFLPHNPAGVTAPIYVPSDNHNELGYGPWNAVSVSTSEILNRGPPGSNVVFSSLVAAFSGVAVALGHTGGLPSALAGVALSTSLLPPLVNVGLMLGLSCFYPHVQTSRGDHLTTVAAYSVMIYLVNVVAVCLFAFGTLKFKRIGGRSLRAAKREFGASGTTSFAETPTPQDEAPLDAKTLLAPLVSPTPQDAEDDSLFHARGGDNNQGRFASLASDPTSFPSGVTSRRRGFLQPDDVASLPSSDDLRDGLDEHFDYKSFSDDG